MAPTVVIADENEDAETSREGLILAAPIEEP